MVHSISLSLSGLSQVLPNRVQLTAALRYTLHRASLFDPPQLKSMR